MKSKRHRADDRNTRGEERAPKHGGDVLGVSDARPDVHIPTKGGSDAVQGIDVRQPATGSGDVPQRSGATGIDMGAGGEGTHVSEHERRPKSAEPTEE